ncbi:MAG: site-specific integrase [Candidatus Acidifodinimicrobium sp.]
MNKGKALFKNKEVERWYRNLARGSIITADVYLRRLSRFCEETKLSPEDLVSMDEKKVTDLLQDYISSHEGKYAGSYLVSIVKIVRSWLAYNGKEMRRKIKVKDAEQSLTLRNERVPTQEELRKILGNATIQSRVTCSLMAFSGLRPETIGNYDGNDGLTLGDLPDLEVYGTEVSFKNIPAMIVVRPELSKTKRQYFTFLGPEGCRYLKEYLESRLRSGEKLDSSTPIVTPKVSRRKPFVSTMNIGDQVRKAIRLAGMKQRPYVLRAYFDTQLMMAESKGLIMRDYRTFMMGHVGDIEHRYTLNKNRLPDKTISDMRESYSRALKFIETEPKGIPEEDLTKKLREFALMIFETQLGLKLDDKEKERLYSLPIEEFQEELRKMTNARKTEIINNGHKQRVIALNEVESFIEKGWDFVSSLPGEKAIVKLPDRL